MNTQADPESLGPIITEFRMTRFTVILAYFATSIIGLFWLIIFIAAISVLTNGSVPWWSVLLWSIPITLLFVGAIWFTRLLHRTLLQQREMGIVFRDHAQLYVIPYDTIKHSEVVAVTRYLRSGTGVNYFTLIPYLHHLLVITLKQDDKEIRIAPWFMRDPQRLQKIHMASIRNSGL